MNSFVVMIELRIFRIEGLFLKVIKLSTVFAIIFLTLGYKPWQKRVEHRGYMYFDVVVSNSNYSSANAFGHYGHTTLALGSIGLDLSTGSFKITPSLTTIVTYMRDTGVTFQTK